MALVYSDLVKSLGPVAYWRMGEASGNLADSSGNGVTATAHGSPTYAQTGLIGNDPNTAIKLTAATSDYFSYAAQLASLSTFTVCAWVNFTDSGQTHQCVVGSDSGATSGYFLLLKVDATHFHITYNEGGGDKPGTTSISTGVTHFLAWSMAGGVLSMYIDGGLDANGAISGLNGIGAEGQRQIGKDNGASEFFNGSIQDVALFNKALTAAQVNTLNLAGVGAATTAYGGNYPSGIKPVLFVTPASASVNAPLGVRKVINADVFSGPNFPADVLPVSLSAPPQLYKCVAIAQPGDVSTSFPPGVLPVLPVDATGTPV